MSLAVVSKMTPAEVMYIMDLTLTDIVRSTGLSNGTVRRAMLGNGKRIHIMSAHLIAEAVGLSVDDIAWPGSLTSAGRTPLTGGNYTIGAGSRVSDSSAQYAAREVQVMASFRKPEFQPRFCSHPDHNLALPLTGVCDFCVD